MTTQSILRLIAACAVLISTVGCNAFDDSDKEEKILQPILEQLSQAEEKEELDQKIDELRPIIEALVEEEALKKPDAEAPATPGEKPPAEEAPPAAKVVCTINAAVAVTTPEEGSTENLVARMPNLLNGETSLTSARWIDDNTTMITTGNGSEQLVITIQKQADGTFGLCDAVYMQGDMALPVTGGTITVEQFNRSEEKKIINAGSYELTVGPSTEATKAAQILLGKAATAPQALTAAGNYYSESLIIVAE